MEAGRNVDIKVKLFDEEEGVVLYLNQICIVSIATQAKHFSHGMCAFRPTKDVLHVSIIDIAPDFKKVFLFKQNDLASSPLTIRASPKGIYDTIYFFLKTCRFFIIIVYFKIY